MFNVECSAGAKGEEVEPAVGIELTTDGLQNRCVTAELRWLRDAQIVQRILVATVKARFAKKHPST